MHANSLLFIHVPLPNRTIGSIVAPRTTGIPIGSDTETGGEVGYSCGVECQGCQVLGTTRALANALYSRQSTHDPYRL
jgi:hypothetical protein